MHRSYKHPYPEEVCRNKEEARIKAEKAARRERRAAALSGTGVRYRHSLLLLRPAAHSACTQVMAPPTPVAVPATPVAFLFPGQGSQAVGMLQSCKDLPAVATMLATAKRVLGYDLLSICVDGAFLRALSARLRRLCADGAAAGPKSKLDDTVYAQPALFVAGLAAVEKLRSQDARAADGASACAGLSLGEYTALVHAGALSFEDGLKVVKVRAESMAAAAAAGQPHGMLSVVGLADSDLKKICDAAAAAAGPGCVGARRGVRSLATLTRAASRAVCSVANYLFPQGRVVSGDKAVLEDVLAKVTAAGALQAKMLAVSGAFHTSRMASAAEALKSVLAEVSFQQPRIPVYSNVTGEPFPDAAAIPALLARQLTEPVMWEDSIKARVGAGKNQLYELGPGQQIKAMVKRIDPNVWSATKNVNP